MMALACTAGFLRGQHRPPTRQALIATVGMLVSVSGGIAALVPPAETLEQARRELAALTPAGAKPLAWEHRQRVYESLRASLAPLTTDADRTVAATAAVLVAHATAGLADAPAARAGSLIADNIQEMTQVRAVLSRYLAHQALAAGVSGYDPAAELAHLDQADVQLDQAIRHETARKTEVDRRIMELQTQSQRLARESAELRQEAGRLRSRVADETAVRGAELAEQARRITRRADRLAGRAAELDARAAQIAPQSAEIQLELDKLAVQKQLVAQGRAQIQASLASVRDSARQAQENARAAAADIEALVQSLVSRQTEIERAADEAVAGYQAAAQAARQAAGELRTTAHVAAATAHQSAAETLWNLAQTHAALAATLESLASARPPLPQAEDWRAQADQWRGAAAAAIERAVAAYREAFDALQTAGARGQGAQAVSDLAARLRRTVRTITGGRVDLGDGSADVEPPPAPPPSSLSAPPDDSPRATLQALFDLERTGQVERLPEFFAIQTDAQRRALTSLASLAVRFKALDEAMKTRFGRGLEVENVPGMPPGGLPLASPPDLRPDNIEIRHSGETAEATLPGGVTLRFLRRDGRWLIDPASMGLTPEALTMMEATLGPMSQAVDELAADVAAGKYPSAEAAMQDLFARIMRLMMQNAPPGQIPPRPPY